MRLTGGCLEDDAPDLVRFSSSFSSSSSSSLLSKLMFVAWECMSLSLFRGLNESLKCISNKRLRIRIAVTI